MQAFAEVLPIGSAAQLALVNAWADFLSVNSLMPTAPGLGLGIRAGLACGTAAYFWEDLAEIASGLVRLAKGKRDPRARLAFLMVAATLPSIGAALLIEKFWGTAWQSALVTA